MLMMLAYQARVPGTRASSAQLGVRFATLKAVSITSVLSKLPPAHGRISKGSLRSQDPPNRRQEHGF